MRLHYVFVQGRLCDSSLCLQEEVGQRESYLLKNKAFLVDSSLFPLRQVAERIVSAWIIWCVWICSLHLKPVSERRSVPADHIHRGGSVFLRIWLHWAALQHKWVLEPQLPPAPTQTSSQCRVSCMLITTHQQEEQWHVWSVSVEMKIKKSHCNLFFF